MISESNTTAAALVCTHKRGAALALFSSPSADVWAALRHAAEELLLLSCETPREFPLPHTRVSAHCLVSAAGSSFFAVCAGLTAENLADLYKLGLNCLDLKDSAVETLGVVQGPGSFTGLRLGCAFVNGLALGRRRSLWSVEGLAPERVRQLCLAQSAELSPFFLGEMSAEQDDPYAVPAAFADLLVHLQHWSVASAQQVAVVEPVYGRDPTPVIKLRQHKGAP